MAGHSAGGVVVNRAGDVVVVAQAGGTWSLPKGHLDDGESTLEAARREIHEECGLTDLDLVGPLGSYSRSAVRDGVAERKTITLFLFTTREERLDPQDPSNPVARWIAPGAVAGMLPHAADRRFFERRVLPRLAVAPRSPADVDPRH